VLRVTLFSLLTAGLFACSATPPLAPDAEPVPPGTWLPGEDVVGRFRGLAGHQAAGTATLRVADGVARVELGSDFSSTRVPDPYVYVGTEPDANRGERLRVSRLQSNTGAQSYNFRVAPGVSYRYVLVWCDKFNVGVGAAGVE